MARKISSDNNSCGDIHNISFPFRLNGDSQDNCGDNNFEFDCENNRTTLHLYSGKYYVLAINYTIQLVDVGVQNNNCSALPLHSLTPANFTIDDSYEPKDHVLAVFVSCGDSLKSPLYIDRSPSVCENASMSSSNLSQRQYLYSYVLVGDLNLSDVEDLCSVDMRVMMKKRFSGRSERHLSFSEVHNELAYGFELSWKFMSCKELRQLALCFSDAQNVTVPCLDLSVWTPTFLGAYVRLSDPSKCYSKF